jgi:hypothetical protein
MNNEEKIRIAYDPNTTIDVLAQLATDESEEVRSAVVFNRNTTAAILETLSYDSSQKVVNAFLSNPNTPDRFLDEPKFDLFQALVAAESRGSELAKQLLEIYLNFDEAASIENHKKLLVLLGQMKNILEETSSDYDEDEQDLAFEEFWATLPPWNVVLFDSDFIPINTSRDSFQLIFDELSRSRTSSGSFGNAEMLMYIAPWENAMNFWGFLISPFIPRNVLARNILFACDSDDYMSSFVVSPILSKRLLNLVADRNRALLGSQWLGLALLINANSDLQVLDSISRNGLSESIAEGYCEFPTSGGMEIQSLGVCGPLVGKSWFAMAEDVFEGWTENDLVGQLSEDAPRVLQNLVKIATLYLETSQGLQENSREKLANSEAFGNLLVAFRMIDEFKCGRAQVDDEIDSESPLIRSILFWMPGLESKARENILKKGVLFPEEVGNILIQGWTENTSLIY